MIARSLVMDHGTLGERLIEEGQISAEDLLYATRLHPALRVKLGQGLLDLSVVRDEHLSNSPDEPVDPPTILPRGGQRLPDLERVLPEHIQRRLGIVPLFDTIDSLVVATDDPENQAAIREAGERVGRPISAVECDAADIDGLLETLNGAEYLRRSIGDLRDRIPEQSAFEVLTKAQGKALWGALAVIAITFAFFPAVAGAIVMGSCMLFYMVFSLYRCHLIYRGLSHDLEVPITQE
ncbi:MAG: hypothetical protein ACRDGS_14010, partial [Chloroflexota bacterium]